MEYICCTNYNISINLNTNKTFLTGWNKNTDGTIGKINTNGVIFNKKCIIYIEYGITITKTSKGKIYIGLRIFQNLDTTKYRDTDISYLIESSVGNVEYEYRRLISLNNLENIKPFIIAENGTCHSAYIKIFILKEIK